MVIGTLTEIKRHEYRIGLTPHDVKSYVSHGHQIVVQTDAGVGSGYPNEEHQDAGAELLPGESTPKLITRDHLKLMKSGAVLVDVAIDQGGIAETSRPTTHDEPIYIIDEVVHYCVANMSGAVARSSTIALTSVTLAYGLLIADLGLEAALASNEPLRKGLNIIGGQCVHEGVARSCGLPFTPYRDT